jgi:hypothetical protein
VLDLVIKQAGEPPFNPRMAVKRFAEAIKSYRLASVTGDNYAGQTFKCDFEAERITYHSCPVPKTELYEALEPALNAGEVELLAEPKLQEQLICLVVRGARVDHQPGDHDDFANAVAGVVWGLKGGTLQDTPIVTPFIASKISMLAGLGTSRVPAHYLKQGDDVWRPYVGLDGVINPSGSWGRI